MSAVEELATKLKAYETPTNGGQVVAIHLFGIEHAASLQTISLPALLDRAGLPASYRTELRKGMNLAPFVLLKD